MQHFGLLIVLWMWYVVLSLLHLVRAGYLFRSFRADSPAIAEPQAWPGVLAVMAIRGGDETLTETLKRLIALDYPNYKVRIILDSSAAEITTQIHQVIDNAQEGLVSVETLRRRLDTCSGKISGMLQATAELPEDCEVVAVFDGDAVLHASCLKELVVPILHGAALSYGNRWYVPEASIASLLRYTWNGIALTSMNFLNIPWGGCMVLRRDIMENSELRLRLSQAFGEDSTIATFLIEQHERVEFVSQATILNRDSCQLKSFYNFLLRQYLTVRLHNPRWPFVFWSNVLLGMTAVVSILSPLIAPIDVSAQMLLGIAVVAGASSLEVATGAILVRRYWTRKQSALPRFSKLHWIKYPIALVLLCFLNAIATLHAMFIRNHLWRGIRYQFPGRKGCQIISVQDV